MTTESEPKHTIADQLTGLARFLPVFSSPDFDFGSWAGGEKTPSGAITWPFFALSDSADAFVSAMYELGWVRQDFDWGEWKGTSEAIELRDSPEALARASAEQLSKLITICVRQERFVDGALASAYESGLLTGIIARAAALTDEARLP